MKNTRRQRTGNQPIFDALADAPRILAFSYIEIPFTFIDHPASVNFPTS